MRFTLEGLAFAVTLAMYFTPGWALDAWKNILYVLATVGLLVLT